MTTIQRALISVSDKSGLEPLVKALHGAGVEILSTGGTAAAIRKLDIPVVDVSEFTESPEVMNGRVKTLHPRVHGGILALRGTDHMEDLKTIGGKPIDLVAVNLYPFKATVEKPGCSLAEAIENIDIGGPSMVRSAAKNFRQVVILTCPGQYQGFLDEWQGGQGSLTSNSRLEYARAAFQHTHVYDGMVAGVLARPLEDMIATPDQELPAANPMPNLIPLTLESRISLRYGENPHQAAGWYMAAGEPQAWQQLQGKGLSYNNLLDLEAAKAIVQEFERPAVTIIKHTNPCGAAQADSPAAAFSRALTTDPVSAFGSILGLNRTADLEFAETLGSLFVECIIAPDFTPEALEKFSKKKNLRLIRLPDMNLDTAFKPLSCLGGYLAQQPDKRSDLGDRKVVTKRQPDETEWQALEVAWILAKHVKSNAIVFADAQGSLAVGAGQMSRVDAANLAQMKAKLPLAGSAVGSDAFFPFADGLETVAAAGALAVIQPGGSKRDDEVIEAADRLGMTMVFTGHRHFRH